MELVFENNENILKFKSQKICKKCKKLLDDDNYINCSKCREKNRLRMIKIREDSEYRERESEKNWIRDQKYNY